VNLAKVKTVEQTITEKDGKKLLVFHVVPGDQGLMPADIVQIAVKIRISKEALQKTEFQVGGAK